jgi:hypothetical protein
LICLNLSDGDRAISSKRPTAFRIGFHRLCHVEQADKGSYRSSDQANSACVIGTDGQIRRLRKPASVNAAPNETDRREKPASNESTGTPERGPGMGVLFGID